MEGRLFTKQVTEQLKYYVYRLIDPRNGETFYIGKGAGNRVFAHVKGEVGNDADVLTDKLQRIRDIRVDGFEVAHVIHRHGMDEPAAFEVEAALIDAYPEVTNTIGGRASDERGLMHANQIVERYEAKEAVFEHKAVLININRSATERESVYEAVRYAWKIDPKEGCEGRCRASGDTGPYCGSFRRRQVARRDTGEFPRHIGSATGTMGF